MSDLSATHLSRRSLLTVPVAAGLGSLAAPPAEAAVPRNLHGYDWMRGAVGRRLDALTIPGTHDSGARYGVVYYQCQDQAIRTQLDWGVRFLDIRVRAYQGQFYLHHGRTYMGQTWTDVLTTCRSFLQANPSETILMSMKQEYSNEGPDYVNGIYRAKKAPFAGMVVDDGRADHRIGSSAIRGKVVIMSRVPGRPGVRNSGIWGIRFPSGVYLEDHWDLGGALAPRDKKWPLVRDHMANARRHRGDNRLWMTFASCTGAGNTPRYSADRIRPLMQSNLDNTPRSDGERNGIVALDFPAWWQIEQLAARNFGRLRWNS